MDNDPRAQKLASRKDMFAFLREAWAEITQNKIAELVDSMPVRVNALRAA